MTNDKLPFLVDKRGVKSAFNSAASLYDSAAVLQKEVGDRILERLDLIRIKPDKILDVGAGTGRCAVALAQRYKHAQVYSLDVAFAMLKQARSQTPRLQRWRKKHAWICGDAEHLPLNTDSMDMIFSNLTLQWCPDLDQTFREFRRILRPNGLLMFTSLGPDTLKELRQSWQNIDADTHVNAFIDMHDVGDALLRNGFATPVMDVEHITLTYKDTMQLMRELKTIGAHNVTAGRQRGLTPQAKLKAMMSHYENFRRDGLLPSTYEIVYGHAWTPEQNTSKHQHHGETKIAINNISRSTR